MNGEDYWDKRANKLQRHKVEESFTTIPLPFYLYRRNRILNVLNAINMEGKRCLDLGCGDGYYSVYLKNRGASVTGVDISNDMLNLAKRRAGGENLDIPFHKIDDEHLPFNDNYFDFVLTSDVLQHVTDKGKLGILLDEIARVLVAGGHVSIFEALTSKRKKQNPKSTMVVRTFDEYVNLLKAHNLAFESSSVISSPFYYFMMLPYDLLKYRLSIPENNRVETIYSQLLVTITRRSDKVWQWKRTGLLHCVFGKK